LTSLLWSDSAPAQSKRCLRQTLWQLQSALEFQTELSGESLISVGPEWIQLNPHCDLWLDVTAFEQAFRLAHNVPGEKLDPHRARAIQEAADLYQGNLLEGWYPDWCLYERERLQNIHFAMLDKLIGYCEAQHHYEDGLIYGMRLLSHDRARERTHSHLMRLRYLSGDRTGALRQYEQCVAALEQELGVKPSQRTQSLYGLIRADKFLEHLASPTETNAMLEMPTSSLTAMLGSLKQFEFALAAFHTQVGREIQVIESTLRSRY
jgi:DNA-binding SARP family transcriptional activator